MARFVHFAVPLDEPRAVFHDVRDGAAGLTDFHGLTSAQPPPGAHHAAPVLRRGRFEAQQFRASVVGKKARLRHPDIIEDDDILRTHEPGEFAEHAVLHGAAGAVHQHHARVGTVRQRAAGDQFLRQRKVEVISAPHELLVRALFLHHVEDIVADGE